MENEETHFMNRSKVLRLTFSLALLPSGALLVLLAGTGQWGFLLSNLGLSLMVSGVFGAFREIFLLKLETEESSETTAEVVYQKVVTALPRSDGLRLIAPIRRGFVGYYSWAIATDNQDLFFAGRSVLHRIDADFHSRGLGRAEDVLYRRLRDGCSIRILFLDPRSDLLPRLAQEEGQSLDLMLSDIAKSIGVCHRLASLINKGELPHRSRLDIRVYDEVPYFSYHKVNNDIIVGFYFTTSLGSASSAFEVKDPGTQEMFSGHFTAIFAHSSDRILLEVSDRSSNARFNDALFVTLRDVLEKKLGQETVTKQLSNH
jgi:hypothetical protein